MKLEHSDNCTEILDLVNQIKDIHIVPHFYLCGDLPKSFLEKKAISLAEELISKNILSLSGIRHYFTMKFPSIETPTDVKNFTDRIKKSIRIAQDCYLSYKGIIIFEFDDYWKENKPNELFLELIKYLTNMNDIVLIFIDAFYPQSKNNLYTLLSPYSTWQKIEYYRNNKVSSIVEEFLIKLSQQEMSISNEALQYYNGVIGTYPKLSDGHIITQNLAQQLKYESLIKKNNTSIIGIEDIKSAIKPYDKSMINTNRTIGFTMEV